VTPLAVDLFCGLGGWAEGFLAEGWRVIGFDVERYWPSITDSLNVHYNTIWDIEKGCRWKTV
jgi:hypothetical protein